MTYQFYIGIDTGVNTGFCIWQSGNKTIHTIATMKIHDAMDKVKKLVTVVGKDYFFVRVEDARLRKWIPRQANQRAENGRREGAGSVKRDASIWEDFLKDLGVSFEMVAPKNNKTKVSAEYFQSLTGCKEKTSQHARDAAMLVIDF